jgi:phosphohistidine phosphatase
VWIISTSCLTHFLGLMKCAAIAMSSSNDNSDERYTTNDEDQREVARLKERLGKGNSNTARRSVVPNVKIDEGRHKYVQIRAAVDGEEQVFVTSKRGAHYHRDAAEPFISALEEAGYHDIDVAGGGRIDLDTQAKRISIYGYSYGFGLADHELSKSVVLKDPRYKDFDITTSNAGY